MKHWFYLCRNNVHFHTFRNSVVYYMKSIVKRKNYRQKKIHISDEESIFQTRN